MKFQTLYLSEFGMEINREEAYDKGLKLLGLMSTVYKPMTEEEYNEVRKYQTKDHSITNQNN